MLFLIAWVERFRVQRSGFKRQTISYQGILSSMRLQGHFLVNRRDCRLLVVSDFEFILGCFFLPAPFKGAA
jgi:hypothetical protein